MRPREQLRYDLAAALELAYIERDARSSRELSLAITNLEQAALWLTIEPAVDHVGTNVLLDALREI